MKYLLFPLVCILLVSCVANNNSSESIVEPIQSIESTQVDQPPAPTTDITQSEDSNF